MLVWRSSSSLSAAAASEVGNSACNDAARLWGRVRYYHLDPTRLRWYKQHHDALILALVVTSYSAEIPAATEAPHSPWKLTRGEAAKLEGKRARYAAIVSGLADLDPLSGRTHPVFEYRVLPNTWMAEGRSDN